MGLVDKEEDKDEATALEKKQDERIDDEIKKEKEERLKVFKETLEKVNTKNVNEVIDGLDYTGRGYLILDLAYYTKSIKLQFEQLQKKYSKKCDEVFEMGYKAK